MPNRVWTKARSKSSKPGGAASDAGRRRITISAASVSSAVPARQATRVEVVRRPRLREGGDSGVDPTHITAVGTTWVLANRAAARGLGIDRSAVETPNALEHGQVRRFAS